MPASDGAPPAAPPADLTLLLDAVRGAAPVAMHHWQGDPDVVEKPGGQGPVSEGDLAVNAFLERTLRAARPTYAWLSEESPDDGPRRTGDAFVLDPIDGTRAYIDGRKDWAISLATIRDGVPQAGVVHLPAREETYAAALGRGATLNGVPITASGRTEIAGATALAQKNNLAPERWPNGVPPVERKFRSSLAWRLCLAASGRYDAMLTLRDSWYWDICAGSLIAAEAGCAVTDRSGRPLRFDGAVPQTAGCVVAPPALHGHLIP